MYYNLEANKMYYKNILSMKKLVSLRIDEEVLMILDERMKEFPYRKKHAVMCAIIENVLLYAGPCDLRTIVHYNRHSSMSLTIKASKQSTEEKL